MHRNLITKVLILASPALAWLLAFYAFRFIADSYGCSVNDAGPHLCLFGGHDIGGFLDDYGSALELGIVLVFLTYLLIFCVSVIRAILS